MRFKPQASSTMTRSLPALSLATVLYVAAAASVFAQATAVRSACDEGVLRMPDRNGTIQICSALAAKLPDLQKQLNDVTRAVGTQQEQLQAIGRFVRGVNQTGAQLDEAKLKALVSNIADALTQEHRQGQQASYIAITSLAQSFEQLNEKIRRHLGEPHTTSTTQDALRGQAGDAIAALDFGSAQGLLERMIEQIHGKTASIDAKADRMLEKLDRLERLAAAIDPSSIAPEQRGALADVQSDLARARAMVGTKQLDLSANLVESSQHALNNIQRERLRFARAFLKTVIEREKKWQKSEPDPSKAKEILGKARQRLDDASKDRARLDASQFASKDEQLRLLQERSNAKFREDMAQQALLESEQLVRRLNGMDVTRFESTRRTLKEMVLDRFSEAPTFEKAEVARFLNLLEAADALAKTDGPIAGRLKLLDIAIEMEKAAPKTP